MREEILNYFEGDNLATDVFINKYSLGKQETPEEMHNRLADDFARIEDKYSSTYDEELVNKLSDYGKRRANRIAINSDNLRDDILKQFKHFEFIIPGGSVMQGLGSGKPVSLSNCFVLKSPEDNIESIFNTARDAAQIYKRRGGVGLDISNLRPRGAGVDNSANSSTGAVSFMHLYSEVTNIICQEGRRGALMLSIDVNHPDVFEFANVKKDLTKITGANISIRLNDKFLKAVKEDGDYILQYPCSNLDIIIDPNTLEYNELKDCSFEYNGINHPLYYKRIRAKELWDNIVSNAHLTAEPGIFNWDRLVNYDPTGVYDELKPVSTNPCGELGLSGYDSCRLIATNLYSLVEKPFTKDAALDTILAYNVFYEAQVLADDLVDLELEAVDKILIKINPEYSHYLTSENEIYKAHFLECQTEEFKLWFKVRKIGSKGRRTGTGITAYADMLSALSKPYGDEYTTDLIFNIKLQAELDATIDMAILRGSFLLWDVHKEYCIVGDEMNGYVDTGGYNQWYNFITDTYPEQYKKMLYYGRRNAGISTIAPTGTVSIMTQTSSGIEPVFMPVYKRKVTCQGDEKPDIVEQGIGYRVVPVIHPKLKEWYKVVGYQVLEQHLGEGLDKVPDVENLSYNDWMYLYQYSPYYFQSSGDISPEVRVKTQSLIQKYITSSISSTVNLPSHTTKEVIEELYLNAFEQGCKGITVYRDGSRGGILVTDTNKTIFEQHKAPKRPKDLTANLHITKSKGHFYYVFIGLLDGKPYEVFVTEVLPEDYEYIKKYLDKNDLSVVSGVTTKVKKNHYSFKSDIVSMDKLIEGNDELEKACALYTSMLLRHGANIHYVVKTAKKINDSITSFVSAMCRILNKYDEVKEELVCDKCGGKVIKESGCQKCLDCGDSKCN